MMSPEVTHIVAEVENSIHSQVSIIMRFPDCNLTFNLHSPSAIRNTKLKLARALPLPLKQHQFFLAYSTR